ncbi:MAG: hypothetical protein ACLFTI_13790 [Anaerolineales bacterium]
MFKWFLPTAVAMLVGMLVLLSTLIPIAGLGYTGFLLIQWGMVLGTFALLLGYFNILSVHLQRLFRKRKNWSGSLLLVLSALGSLVLIVWQGPGGQGPQFLLRHVLIPGESALLALTAITLIIAGMRLFRTRRDFNSVVFIVVAGTVLLSTVPYFSIMSRVKMEATNLAAGGMRGILIGVAIGTTMTGLRIILGIDRPHSDE